MPTCTVVVGTPRSGTNCVAGILAKLGIYMGKDFAPPAPLNPAGFYQDLEFETLCDEIFGLNFQPDFPYPLDPESKAVLNLRTFIRSREAMGQDWGIKTRHSSYLLDLFREECKSLQLVVTSRPRQDSIDSLANYLPLSVASVAIDNAAKARDYALSLGLPSIQVDYDQLTTKPDIGVAAIAAFVGTPVTQVAVDWVDPSLNRFGG